MKFLASTLGLLALSVLAQAVEPAPESAVFAKPALQSSPSMKTAPLKSVKVSLNWVAEPEFGGFYQALHDGLYKEKGLDVELIQGGAGAPTVTLVAEKKVDIGVASMPEVLVARERDARIVASFSVYHTSPLILMAHRSRGFKHISDIFSSKGLLSIEQGQAFSQFLEKKYSYKNLTVVPYAGGVGAFLANNQMVQQGFIFSEPIVAARQGAQVDTFKIADAGYNPYIEVLVFHEDDLKTRERFCRDFVEASREGWLRYNKNPATVNKMMAKLNRAMPLEVFEEGAKSQIPFIVANDKSKDLGLIDLARVQAMENQLLEFSVLKSKSTNLASSFRNF